MNKGLIHIYYGDGKGKTAAAIGQGVCAASTNSTVYFASFFKSEHKQIDALKQIDGFFFAAMPVKPLTKNKKEEHAEILRLFHEILIQTANNDYDMLVLDDVLTAVDLNIIPETDLLTFLSFKPSKLTVVLTGSSITPRIAACSKNVSFVTSNIKY